MRTANLVGESTRSLAQSPESFRSVDQALAANGGVERITVCRHRAGVAVGLEVGPRRRIGADRGVGSDELPAWLGNRRPALRQQLLDAAIDRDERAVVLRAGHIRI